MGYDTFMRGRGKLAGLPPLTPHQEKPILRGIALGRLPETGKIDMETWFDLIREDLENLDSNSLSSYWHYPMEDGDSLLEMMESLQAGGYCESDGGLYYRTRKTATFSERPVTTYLDFLVVRADDGGERPPMRVELPVNRQVLADPHSNAITRLELMSRHRLNSAPSVRGRSPTSPRSD